MSEWQTDRTRKIIGWSIVGVIAAIGVSVVVSLLLAPQLSSGYHYYYPFFPFRFGWLGGIFVIFLIFIVARWLLWPWRGRGWGYYRYPPQQYRQDAESIVRERYAKGEITKEQFEQMLRDLRQQEG